MDTLPAHRKVVRVLPHRLTLELRLSAQKHLSAVNKVCCHSKRFIQSGTGTLAGFWSAQANRPIPLPSSQVEQLKAAHAQCKPRAGLAAKEEPAPFPAPERQPQPGQPPVFGGNEWIGRSYSPPDLKHKSMRVVSLLDPDSGSGPTAPSFRSPFDAFPAPPANADSYAATPFAPSSTYLSFRNEVFPPPASAPAFFPPAPEPKGDITLDEAFSGVLRHGSGMGSMEGLVFNEGAGFRAPPAPGMAVPASSAGVAGQPLGGGLAEWAGQAQEGGASAAAPTWDTGLRRGDAEDIWQGMERRLPAWYFRNQRG